MSRTTKANSILGAVIAVLALLAIAYYVGGPSQIAQAPAQPAATNTAQTPAPAPDPTSTGSTRP